MTISDDTICAISTPKGTGGIAIVRISGSKAIEIASKLWRGKPLDMVESHTAHLGEIYDSEGARLDQGIVTIFRTPHSFTGDDVIELSIHGSTYIQQQLIRSLVDAGARMAQPGEFTRRAFQSGRMDLAQAESVADLIASTSAASHRLAISQMRGDFSARITRLHDRLLELASLLELELDFSEEDVEFASRERLMQLAVEIRDYVSRLADSFALGHAIKNGVPVTLTGAPNAGKSTLLNALADDDRAIVSDIRGTTRDTIEDTVEINGTTFRFIDTAGLHDTTDPIETLGINKTQDKISSSSIVIWLIDVTSPLTETMDAWHRISGSLSDARLLILFNKTDLAEPSDTLRQAIAALPLPAGTILSTHTSQSSDSLTRLRETLTKMLPQHTDGDIIVTNIRHYEALTNARTAISRAISALTDNLPPDIIAQDIRETLHHLSTITGAITTDTILTTIFSRFCIGK